MCCQIQQILLVQNWILVQIHLVNKVLNIYGLLQQTVKIFKIQLSIWTKTYLEKDFYIQGLLYKVVQISRNQILIQIKIKLVKIVLNIQVLLQVIVKISKTQDSK
ncbi:hypothetical protein TTHERM_000085249 (macronuclear) [Tetrahymena thermophila SB210]|uniref:Uncharacterized protein n=1 Tax=Tetrahymena thermophila (strain SB210) TaxID=312017 RepID=W7XKU5_TETTS|nr:hypothetical protein TTHERM_000085249 [Tetrahymena thermophila SB210]EWS75239.1 hypothetical protein TTHERM_000085249 [Tetrahymena thermophila SB210]|eukprot:XP_012652230.1 hypothetical protein TTHERM_000085249 [Tetrahymena thermophila SB210]